jgi:catechol 2,3-dioxygenase-like lactoylglutathione lyase family enzyme
MEKVTGIGGVFFRARDPEGLAAWYAAHLGLAPGAGGTPWRQEAGFTVFAPFPADTDYFPTERTFMLNLRVADLDAMLAQLAAAGIEAETRAEWDGPHGRFARIHDPEGNPIELWQPPAP